MKSPRLAVFLVAAVVAPVATAAGTAHAQAESGTMEGVSLLSAQLLALVQESRNAQPSPAGFHLAAASVVVETTVRDPSAHGAGVSMGMDPSTESEEARNAVLEGTAARPGGRFDVFALPRHAPPTLAAETGCSAWEASDADEVTRDPIIPTRADRTVTVATAGATQVSDCGTQAAWTIKGDFVVLVWERDFHVQDHQGSRDVQSGRLQPANRPFAGLAGEGPAGSTVSKDQEVYLYVSNGTLRIPMDTRTVAWVAPGAQASTHGTLRLHGATLGLPGEAAPLQGLVEVQGRIAATFRSSGGLLDIDLEGAFQAPHHTPEGEPVPDAESGPAPWAWLAVAALAAAAAVAWRRRTPARAVPAPSQRF